MKGLPPRLKWCRTLALAGPSATLGIGLLVNCRATAQERGPLRLTREPEYRTIGFDNVELALRLEWRLDRDEVDREDDEDEETSENRFREILELDTDGYIGHPNLVALDLNSEFWLTQREFDFGEPGGRESTDELLLDFDLNALVLRESMLPLTVYARRTQNDINRQFGGTLENTVSQYGARLDLRLDHFPMRAEVYHRELEQRDPTGESDFTIEQDTFAADGQAELTPTQRLWWDFTYDDIAESGLVFQPRDYERLEFNTTHTLDFGEEDQHQLRSLTRIYRESGDRRFEQFRLNERLRFRHTRNFITRYEYAGELLERDDFEQRRHEISALARHQLFESLTTVGRVGYRVLDIPTSDFIAEEAFGELTVDYTKRVPAGRVFAGVDLAIRHLDESERGSQVQIIDQLLVFDASGLIIINQENIDPSSIVITDTSGLIQYTEGDDYTVFASPTRVEIRRVLGGDIAAGQAVLVDYVILPEPGGTTDTLGVGMEFRYTFTETALRGLSLYTRIFENDESRSTSGFDPDMPVLENDFTDLLFGTEFTRGPVFTRAEYQMHDSPIDPFDALRMEGRYTYHLDRDSNLQFSVLYQDLERTEQNLRTQTTTFSGRWNQRFSTNLRGNLLLLWQNEQSDFGGDADAFEQEVNLFWKRGKTDVYARVRNVYRDTDHDDTSFQTFFVGIRREF